MRREQPPLFVADDSGVAPQACTECSATCRASNDSLRMRGWLVYDGESMTGQLLHVRVCTDCQHRAEVRQKRERTSRRREERKRQPLLPLELPAAPSA